MQSLLEFMNRDRLKKYKVKPEYHYFPKSKFELETLIMKLIDERGYEADLNDIDTSRVRNMATLFCGSNSMLKFNGDISQWDVSWVTDMYKMFANSNFDGDISQWDVRKVSDMGKMFENSSFKQDISNWKVDSLQFSREMFKGCPLESHPPKWYKG